jgi:hypothetical protein
MKMNCLLSFFIGKIVQRFYRHLAKYKNRFGRLYCSIEFPRVPLPPSKPRGGDGGGVKSPILSLLYKLDNGRFIDRPKEVNAARQPAYINSRLTN